MVIAIYIIIVSICFEIVHCQTVIGKLATVCLNTSRNCSLRNLQHYSKNSNLHNIETYAVCTSLLFDKQTRTSLTVNTLKFVFFLQVYS